MFHEAAGLALIGVFIVHVLINYRWVAGVTARLFNRETRMPARICWIVDTLLLVSFIMIGVTGVMISKKLFGFFGTRQQKTMHYFFSALSIIMMGIHLGLHGAFIKKNALVCVLEERNSLLFTA